MVLAFESADHPLEPWMKRALECCADFGGKVPEAAAKTRTDAEATHEGAAGARGNPVLQPPDLPATVGAVGGVGGNFPPRTNVGHFPEFNAPLMAAARQSAQPPRAEG